MDKRRLDIIKAAAEFSGIEIKDKDQLSELIQQEIAKSNRYASVFCVPGGIACFGYASFLTHAFGAHEDKAFVDGFFGEDVSDLWKTRKYMPNLYGVSKTTGMSLLETMAMEMAASLVNSDGNKDIAFESLLYDTSEKMDYPHVVENVAQVMCTILEHASKDHGQTLVREMHAKFIRAYKVFIVDVRGHRDIVDILPSIESALENEDPTVGIPMMLISTVMTSISTSVPLEVYEKFWNTLRGEGIDINANITEVMSGYSEKAQGFIEDIGKSLED